MNDLVAIEAVHREEEKPVREREGLDSKFSNVGGEGRERKCVFELQERIR